MKLFLAQVDIIWIQRASFSPNLLVARLHLNFPFLETVELLLYLVGLDLANCELHIAIVLRSSLNCKSLSF